MRGKPAELYSRHIQHIDLIPRPAIFWSWTLIKWLQSHASQAKIDSSDGRTERPMTLLTHVWRVNFVTGWQDKQDGVSKFALAVLVMILFCDAPEGAR